MTESILPPEGQIYSKAGTDEAIAKAIGSGSGVDEAEVRAIVEGMDLSPPRRTICRLVRAVLTRLPLRAESSLAASQWGASTAAPTATPGGVTFSHYSTFQRLTAFSSARDAGTTTCFSP